jgi:hypothetical protein
MLTQSTGGKPALLAALSEDHQRYKTKQLGQTSREKACKTSDLMLGCETFGLCNRYFSKANIEMSSNNILSYIRISHLLAVDRKFYRSVRGRSSEASVGLCGVSRIGKQ